MAGILDIFSTIRIILCLCEFQTDGRTERHCSTLYFIYQQPKNFLFFEILYNKGNFPVCLQNRFMSAGSEPVLSLTKKTCITSYFRELSNNHKIKIIKSFPFLLALSIGPSEPTKLELIL